MSSWAFLGLFVVGATLISMIIFLLVKCFFPVTEKTHSNTLLYSLMGLVGSGYAFLLGFVIINLWQSFDRTKVAINSEASNYALMTADSFALPDSFQRDLQGAIGKYIQNVIYDEWITMRWGGHQSEVSFNLFLNLLKVIQSYTPRTEGEKVFYGEVVKDFNHAYENRRTRVFSLSKPLMATLRFILIFDGFLLILFISFLYNKKTILHFAFTSIVSIVIFLNVGLALLLQYPFALNLIKSDAYTQGILARYKKP